MCEIQSWVFPVLFLSPLSSQASPALNTPFQVTSNPGEDFAPTRFCGREVHGLCLGQVGKLGLVVETSGAGHPVTGLKTNFS